MLKNVNSFINTKCCFFSFYTLCRTIGLQGLMVKGSHYSSLFIGMLKSANNYILAVLKSEKWAKTKHLKICGRPCSLNQIIIIQSTSDFIQIRYINFDKSRTNSYIKSTYAFSCGAWQEDQQNQTFPSKDHRCCFGSVTGLL